MKENPCTCSDDDQHAIIFASLDAVFLIRRRMFVARARDRGNTQQTSGKNMTGISHRELFLKKKTS